MRRRLTKRKKASPTSRGRQRANAVDEGMDAQNGGNNRMTRPFKSKVKELPMKWYEPRSCGSGTTSIIEAGGIETDSREIIDYENRF